MVAAEREAEFKDEQQAIELVQRHILSGTNPTGPVAAIPAPSKIVVKKNIAPVSRVSRKKGIVRSFNKGIGYIQYDDPTSRKGTKKLKVFFNFREVVIPESIVPTLKTQYARNTWRTSNLFEGSNVQFEIGLYKGKQVANAITIDEVEVKIRKEAAPPPPVVMKPAISMATIPTATTALATGGSSWANMAAKPAVAPTIIHPPPAPPQDPKYEEEDLYKDINIANLLNPNNPQYNPELAAKVKLYNKKAKNQKKKEKKEKKKDDHSLTDEPPSSPVPVNAMSPQVSPQTSLTSPTQQGFLGVALGAPGFGSSSLLQQSPPGPPSMSSLSQGPPPPGFTGSGSGSLSPGLNGLIPSGMPFRGMGDDHNVQPPSGSDSLLNPSSSSQSSVGGAR